MGDAVLTYGGQAFFSHRSNACVITIIQVHHVGISDTCGRPLSPGEEDQSRRTRSRVAEEDATYMGIIVIDMSWRVTGGASRGGRRCGGESALGEVLFAGSFPLVSCTVILRRDYGRLSARDAHVTRGGI